MRAVSLLPIGLFASLALATSAAHADWEKLGERKVDFLGDHDTIGVTAAEGLFNAIKLDVDDGDLEMWNVVVTFGDGSKFSPDTRWNFDQGTRSRTIDLPGDARIIKKVEFAYKSKLKRKGRATMALYGRHPERAPDPTPPADPGDGRWEKLGERKVDFLGDHDTIGVTAAEGLFNAIKLDVDDGDLEMWNVVVTFGDGSKFSPDTRWNFDQGTRSRTIDLPGDARIIKKVEFAYKSKLKRKGRATMALYGRHAAKATPVVVVPAAPTEPRWEKLGERKVKFLAEKDHIMVTAKEGLFTAIRLEVDDGDLEMYNVVVTFGDGSKFSPDTRWNFDQGTRSRVIDLPGDARFIKRVDFAYRSKLRKGRATMNLFGRHAN